MATYLDWDSHPHDYNAFGSFKLENVKIFVK